MRTSTISHQRAQGASSRLPLGIGLSLAALASLGLWAAIVEVILAFWG